MASINDNPAIFGTGNFDLPVYAGCEYVMAVKAVGYFWTGDFSAKIQYKCGTGDWLDIDGATFSVASGSQERRFTALPNMRLNIGANTVTTGINCTLQQVLK
jgi:hypothetical protein